MLFDEWRSYLREVIPPNAPFVQREECRRAFYAGAFAALGLSMDAANNPSLTDDDVARVVTALRDEALSVQRDLGLPTPPAHVPRGT